MTNYPAISWRSEARWAQVLSSFSIDPRTVFHRSVYDPAIRTYLHSDSAHKITLKTDIPDLYPKLAPRALEAEMLRRCEGIRGVPSVHDFRETTAACVLSMTRLDGTALQDVIGNLPPAQASRILVRLLRTIVAVSWCGIAHNDIVPRSIIIDAHGRPWLVDFDQAHRTGRANALLRNVLGAGTNDPWIYGSWLSIVARFAYWLLSGRRAIGASVLAPDASRSQGKLVVAWKTARRASAKAGGEPAAYCSLCVGDLMLPGERPWEPRWEMLRGAADFSGLRALDLGCNMGLLCTWLLKEGGAASAVGVDRDSLLLSAAKLVAEAFSVDASFEKVDLDAAYEWERRFDPADFDVIFALNVLGCVRTKQRLMDFLAGFPLVVFEGHDRDAVEIGRFSYAGFMTHVVLGTSDRGRTVFVFSK